MSAPKPAPVYRDVQGFVRFGYGSLKEACYYLLRVANAAAARAWLLGADIANAENRSSAPATAINVAFTAEGLLALGVPSAIVSDFSPEFVAGIAGDESRSRRLGDVGANAPAHWTWGAAGSVPHVVVMLFALPNGLAELESRCTGAWDGAFDVLRRLCTSDLGDHEQFGFRDGLSQPDVDWGRSLDVTGDVLRYRNRTALGEFLLGYPNEYGQYTERPLVDADDLSRDLDPAEDAPEKRDLGKNGTYVVMRHLRQDVRGFWRFISAQCGGDADRTDTLGAQLVGRTREGVPLARPTAAADSTQINDFTYDDDPDGTRTPIGAHIRRGNPRNADLPRPPTGPLAYLVAMLALGAQRFGADMTSSVRFHRILRRGREFGPKLPLEEARGPGPDDGFERGLHFLCVNSNILRQFEFLQNAWLMGTKFAGLTDESDPLLGNREPRPGCPVTSGFSIPRQGAVPRRIAGLPQFVTVRGGAYLFMPGLSALRYLARVGTRTEERFT